jgi:hypothetical protein
MGIEYMIDYPCRPKKEMGEEHLFNLVKQARENIPERGVGTVETAQIIDVPTGGAGNDVAAKLRKDLSQLDFYFSDCMSCPVNSAADKAGSGVEAAFGCHLEIKYPIRSPMETALLNAGKEALQNPSGNPGLKLVKGILRTHAKSKKSPANKVRKMGRDYFEAKTPQIAKIQLGEERTVIDTNQLMTLLMLGPIPPPAMGAFSVLLDRGIERSRVEGITDPWVLAPLKMLAAHAKAAGAVGKPIKVSF